MNGIQYALRRVHGGENELGNALLQLAERHRVDHEVHHVARDLATWSHRHVRLIAECGARFELELDDEPATPHNAGRHVREAVAAAVGRRPEPGLLLLEDLQDLYLRAAENSLAWELVAQVAQAKSHAELLELTQQCHPQTLRQVRWANTMIKVLSPQILSSM
jgi:hypothetical protein